MRRKDKRYLEEKMRIALEETVPPPKPIFTPDNFEEEFMQWIREKNQKEYEAFCRSVDWDSIKVAKCNEHWVRFKLWVLDKYYILTDKEYRSWVKEAREEMDREVED